MRGMALAALAALAASGCGTARTDADSAADTTGDHDGDSGDAWTEPETCTCPIGLADCDGYCLDLLSNVKNCGSCGNACGTDQACIDGDCVALCEEMSFSTTEDLAALLSNPSWVSTTGVMRYAVAAAEVSITSADVGEGYMFVSDIAGVSLASAIVYGFDDSLESTFDCYYWIRPMYPSTAYGSMTIQAGISFVAGLESYGESIPDDRCSDVYYCDWPFLPPPYSYACCCTVEPFLWNTLTLSPAPDVCTDGIAPCDTDFASTNHSLCRSSYEDHFPVDLDLHLGCVDGDRGCWLGARPCSCNVIMGDVEVTRNGTCTDTGRCDTGGTGYGNLHDWDPGCY